MRKSFKIHMQLTACFFLKNMFFVLLFLILSLKGYSQTYALPDTNLRNKLISDYPSVMTGNLLNIAAANAYTGALNLNAANIYDASGIQYFTKINSLNLNDNNLTSVPDISGLTSLTILYINNNQLTVPPNISTLINLYDFQVENNKLVSLPSFAGLTNLINIYCQDNQITSISGLSSLTNLQILDIGNNKLTTCPDLSPLINLKQLHIHLNGIDTIIGLSALTNLEWLYAWTNNIRDLSGLNANTKLKILVVGGNNLASLPIFSNKPLFMVDISSNYLSFEDILPLKPLSFFNIITYSPQRLFPLPSNVLREKDNLTFNLGIDQSLNTDKYTWYKNGIAFDSNNTGIKNFPSITFADSGDYYMKITNPGLSGLVLQSTIANLRIEPCLELNSFTMNSLSESCTEGRTINFSSINLGGGIAPFTYSLVTASKNDTLKSTSTDFQGVAGGLYKILVTDSRMCQASKDITIKAVPGCDPVISPNGDGIMDTYFIQETGRVSIYDTNKNLIKELNAPAVWDGTKSDGSLASDGYYAIVVNGKKIIHITLVK